MQSYYFWLIIFLMLIIVLNVLTLVNDACDDFHVELLTHSQAPY